MNPSHPKSIVRRKVREVLNHRAGFGKTEKLLLECINDLLGGGVSLQDLRDAMEWNHSRAFIRSQYADEAEETLWFITSNGVAQQNIA